MSKFIGISGLISAGKSSLAKELSIRFQQDNICTKTMFEQADNNPYLEDFYKFVCGEPGWLPKGEFDAKQKYYASMIQFYFIVNRYKDHKLAQYLLANEFNGVEVVIQDRTIYEDPIFVESLHGQGKFDERDYQVYRDLYDIFSNHFRPLDYLVFLDVTPEVALERACKRDRGSESPLTKDKASGLAYLTWLDKEYKKWLEGMKFHVKDILIVPWNEDHQPVDKIYNYLTRKKN